MKYDYIVKKDQINRNILGYTQHASRYYQAVTDWMNSRHNWEVKKEWILPSPGVIHAFFMAIKALTQIGDSVIIQPPVYYPFYKAILGNQRNIVTNPLIRDEENLTYRIDFDDLEKKARDPNNKVLLFCSPHNPVGRVWSEEELQKISEICLRNNVLVLSDETHFDFILPGNKHTVYSELSGEAEQNCIIFTSPGRTFNFAGTQISNMIIPNSEIYENVYKEFLSNSIFLFNSLGLKACETAYNHYGEWLDEFVLLLEKNRHLVKSYIECFIPKIKVYSLEGTYLQWLDFRACNINTEELEKFMVYDVQWFADEGVLFGEEGVGFERLNLACPASKLKRTLDRLRDDILVNWYN